MLKKPACIEFSEDDNPSSSAPKKGTVVLLGLVTKG